MTDKKEKDGNKQVQVLVFTLGGEELAVEIQCVREVLIPLEIHPLLKSPDFIDGVINLRNHIIAVIDLRKRFNIKEAADKTKTRIIVCKISRFLFGLVVDSVSDVMKIAVKDIDSTPPMVTKGSDDTFFAGIARIDDRVISLIDLEKIITKEETDKLTKIKDASNTGY